MYFPYVDVYGVNKKYIKGGFKTKKEAQYHEAQKKNEIVNHGELFDDVSKTFNQVFIEYMEVEGKMYARATEQYYWFTFRKYIENTIGNRKISGLKYRELQMYFNQLTCGYGNAKNIKKVFNVTYKYAMRNGYIKENHMKLVTLNIKDTTKTKK